MVSAFVGIAPDFHGTGEGPLACLAENITLGGCQPCESIVNPLCAAGPLTLQMSTAIIQQTIGSHFLGALLSKGNQALVPTTSIFTVSYHGEIRSLMWLALNL